MADRSPVRTRVAPSPTGDPHIGTAYTALFNLAFARSQGGQFLLRIEDTDQARSTKKSEQAILDALHWLGLQWDEGPDIGGPCGPYRQSERTEIYREHCKKLLDAGHAYPCFLTSEELAQWRQEQQAKDGPPDTSALGADISPDEAQKRIAAGDPYTVRLRVPGEGECVFQDRLRGEIVIPWANVDHQVLMKSDGFPTYHLANVVDDHLMGITHVIRGEEWISSAPKHVLLYKYFGWNPPEFIHQPLLRNPDKSKLSNRKNPTGIVYYERAGFLPEALVNYLCLMSYAPPDGGEMFALDEFIKQFNLDHISMGGPVFDLKKLTWLNARYLRETLSPEQLLDRAKEWMLNDRSWSRIFPLAQKRIEKFTDLVPLSAYLFADRLDYPAELLVTKALDGPAIARLLKIAQWELEKLNGWDDDALKGCLETIASREDLKLRDLVAPFYVAISGATTSLPLFESMAILGGDMTRRRLQYALETLAEAGFDLKGKKMKKLEKDYRSKYTMQGVAE